MKVGDRQITMRRGWVVQYLDGTVHCEEDMHWSKLPNKKDLKRVVLKWDDRFWEVSGKEHYVAPSLREFIDVQAGGVSPQQVHSRTIGYYDLEEKCKVILRVEEATGKANYEIIPF